MSELLWDTPETLQQLLCELVSWESRTHTEGERRFPYKLQEKLACLDYFQKHPERLSLHKADLGRHFVTAFYKHPKVKDTVVLISHFDTVATEEYGDLEHLAHRPNELTQELLHRKTHLKEDARLDLESGNYLFGRGTMDMKMGLALHMSLIEKASMENWPINILLLTVPDEEVNSAGMRSAVTELVLMRDRYDITYQLFLNSEPSFPQKPGDQKQYIYSGSMGKIMPAALFYGKETHVGEPLKGMTANYIASYLTQLMEWNSLFREQHLGESTPLPVSLQQKDLQLQYSVQTPYRAVALYNVFLLKRSASEVMDLFESIANEAAKRCNDAYQELCRQEQITGIGEVKVLRYGELLHYAENKFGSDFIVQLKNEVLKNDQWDEREKSLRLADKLMTRCQELIPSIVILFAPPYYPAVNSSDSKVVKNAVNVLKDTAKKLDIDVSQIHYFNGICDLSYVQYSDDGTDWTVFEQNTPIWGTSYSIPFQDMMELQAPVLNVGPFGKDAHQSTERLHKESAFVQTPIMLKRLIKSLF